MTKSPEITESDSDTYSNFNPESLNVDLKTGWSRRLGQAGGLFYKRWKHSHRNWRFLLSALVLPTILMTLCLTLALMKPTTERFPLPLTPTIYGPESASFVE